MSKGRYTLGKLKKALRNPSMFVNEARRLWNLSVNNFWRQYSLRRYGQPVDIMAADWDTLIVLDACRYDALRKLNRFESPVERVVSPGSKSSEWLAKTFEEDAHDVVYVSANAFTEFLRDGAVHHAIKTYADCESLMAGRLPEHVTDVALQAHREYPDKRIIVHYMQPHEPYIGESADNLRAELSEQHGIDFSAIKGTRGEIPTGEVEESSGPSSLLMAGHDGYLSADEVYQVYLDTLRECLPEVERLVNEIDGKAVVTADHGELLGDKQSIIGNVGWSHPTGCWHPAVRTVPWISIPSDTRRDVSADPPVGSENVDSDRVEAHLRDLGYL